MLTALRSLWTRLGDSDGELPIPYAAPQGAPACPLCKRPVTRIKPSGRARLIYWHGREDACDRSFLTRTQRDRALEAYSPYERGERDDD